MKNLIQKNCTALPSGTPALTQSQAEALLAEVPGWKITDDGLFIQKAFEFKNYYHTTAFINAVIFICHQEDHHPDIQFSYKSCTITYNTHTVNGLSENDFICAAKINALLDKAK